MAKTFIGDACAYCKTPDMAKAKYPRIGAAFADEEGQISVKIDSVPIPNSGWTGWVNIFPRKEKTETVADRDKAFRSNDDEDDIPF